jgi:hypothetical protein
MSLTAVELIFNDSPSKFNKELTDFLRKNLEKIVLRGQIKIIFKIVEPGDIEKLRKREITRLPAMNIPGSRTPIMGVPDIVEYFRQKVKNSRNVAPPKTEEEVLSEYMNSEMRASKDSDGKLITPNDQEDTDQSGSELQSLALKEIERRQKELSDFKGNQISEKNSRGGRSAPPSNPRQDARQEHTPQHHNPRSDNIAAAAGDPMTVLNNMKKTGDENADDNLMGMLLQRMDTGGSDF